MRITTVLRRVPGATQMFVKQSALSVSRALTLSLVPSWRRSRCRSCGRKPPPYDRHPAPASPHLALRRTPVWLRYSPSRVSCRHASVRVKRVSWAAGSRAFTTPFHGLTAYLAQVTEPLCHAKSTVATVR